MKKWKTVLIIIVSVIVLSAGAAFSVYHFYVVPKYIEPMLETAAYILNDDSVKDEISQIAEELRQKGLLDDELVSEFVAENAAVQATPEPTPDAGQSAEPQNTETAETTETTGRKYSYGKKNNATKEEAEKVTPKPSVDTSNLYERVKSQVEPEDLKRGYEFLGKLDMSKIRSLASDRAELKKYIKNTLTEDEYAELIGLYIKYSYLLKQ